MDGCLHDQTGVGSARETSQLQPAGATAVASAPDSYRTD